DIGHKYRRAGGQQNARSDNQPGAHEEEYRRIPRHFRGASRSQPLMHILVAEDEEEQREEIPEDLPRSENTSERLERRIQPFDIGSDTAEIADEDPEESAKQRDNNKQR